MLGLAMSVAALQMSAGAAAQSVNPVVIEVNDTATEADDYFCWAPVPARIKLAAPGAAPVTVRLSSAGRAGGGAVAFQADAGARPTRTTHNPRDELEVTLAADGSWRRVWVSGRTASVGEKDVAIEAQDPATGNVLGDIRVMVRVRKNADTLTSVEINQFTSALARLNGTINGGQAGLDYVKYAIAHDQAFTFGIHGGPNGLPLFLAWHRAFILSIERELQQIDARVAVPCWRFDRPSSNIFSRGFMGTVSGISPPGGLLVNFDNSNPLNNWRMPTGGGLVRGANVTGPADVMSFVDLIARRGNDLYDSPGPRGMNGDTESRYHGMAHNDVGGWLISGSSPRDPLFFLLHGNVDRAWAEWQERFDRFDATDPASYSVQGSYPGPSDPRRFRKGSYALDAMWPWSQDTGAGTSDRGDNWPGTVFRLPPGPASAGPVIPPTPGSMVDYMNVTGIGKAHFSCYDHIDFAGNVT